MAIRAGINDTIAAVATALSESGIGIVRISGENAICIADKIFKGRKKLENTDTHSINYGHIVEDEEKIDEVLLMLMRAPHTFTGEDTVEINCHGGVLIVERVLKAVLNAGARLAESGEFTKRAFLNGKMDLSRAEAVIDIIEAKNSYALKAGMRQLEGGLSKSICELREILLEEIAFIEAALDDPEHYSLDKYPKQLEKKIYDMIKTVDRLIKNSENGSIIREGIDTVILGKPNSGKSSLLNLLSGSERAIVSSIAGTTRDTLTEHIRMSGISLNITDTAGLRESEDIVEKIGISRAREAAENADLIICVIDGSEALDENDMEILAGIEKRKAIVLINKSDMDMLISKADIEKYSSKPSIIFSAKEGIGIEELESLIKELFYKGELDFNDQIYITNMRHIEALKEAKDSLDMVISSINEGLPEDFFSIDMLNAYEALGTVTGETVDDDVVNEIFSKFCMGK